MWIVVVAAILLIGWGLMSYSSSKGVLDNYTNGSVTAPIASASTLVDNAAQVNPSTQTTASVANQNTKNGYALQPVANPADLLPKDQNRKWGEINPVNIPGGGAFPPDLLQAGNLVGIDTIGQTLKNANLDLRSQPIITKQNIGPWNMSTIEPDLARVPLELGCGAP